MLGFSALDHLSSISIVERELIILACEKCRSEDMDTDAGPGPREVMTMPGPVSRLLYGPLAVTYIAETISLSLIIEMLVKVIEFTLTEDKRY